MMLVSLPTVVWLESWLAGGVRFRELLRLLLVLKKHIDKGCRSLLSGEQLRLCIAEEAEEEEEEDVGYYYWYNCCCDSPFEECLCVLMFEVGCYGYIFKFLWAFPFIS